jgi:hypothetical protein
VPYSLVSSVRVHLSPAKLQHQWTMTFIDFGSAIVEEYVQLRSPRSCYMVAHNCLPAGTCRVGMHLAGIVVDCCRKAGFADILLVVDCYSKADLAGYCNSAGYCNLAG